MSNLPSKIFDKNKELKILTLRRNFNRKTTLMPKLLDSLTNLEALQLIGTRSFPLRLPPNFLKNS